MDRQSRNLKGTKKGLPLCLTSSFLLTHWFRRELLIGVAVETMGVDVLRVVPLLPAVVVHGGNCCLASQTGRRNAEKRISILKLNCIISITQLIPV